MNKKKLTYKRNKKEGSELRKDFFKKLLYIVLCAIPLYLLADESGPLRFVAAAFFIVGGYQILQIIIQSQQLVDEFFPPKTRFEVTIKPFDKFVYHFMSVFFFVSLFGLILEIQNFENTVNGLQLFWTAGFVGTGLGIVLTIILKIMQPSIYYESRRRFTVHFVLFVGTFLFSAALAGFINHYFAEPNKICEQYTIEQKSVSNSRRSKSFNIFLTIQGNEERFSIGKTRYDHFEEGEPIELCMRKGKLGFDYVVEFNQLTRN